MDYLERVLAALRAQTLDVARWELLLIDNASDQPLADRVDLACHPRARCVREDELGLTPARLRGIAEAEGELLVFVDDDNVLDRDYLEQAAAIAETYSFLGAWGGSSIGEFEQQPAACVRSFRGALAIQTVDEVRWACDRGRLGPLPRGAGLCIRASVAGYWGQLVAQDPTRIKLGRKGTNLASAEDTDMALTSVDFDLGYGRFPQLRLTHLMPANRVTPKYIRELIYAQAYSLAVVLYIRFGCRNMIRKRHLLRVSLFNLLRRGPTVAAIELARYRGQRDALLNIKRSNNVNESTPKSKGLS